MGLLGGPVLVPPLDEEPCGIRQDVVRHAHDEGPVVGAAPVVDQCVSADLTAHVTGVARPQDGHQHPPVEHYGVHLDLSAEIRNVSRRPILLQTAVSPYLGGRGTEVQVGCSPHPVLLEDQVPYEIQGQPLRSIRCGTVHVPLEVQFGPFHDQGIRLLYRQEG